jgi:hypothetical protein
MKMAQDRLMTLASGPDSLLPDMDSQDACHAFAARKSLNASQSLGVRCRV